MNTARVFTHGGSQAVRLPKEFRFDCTEVHVRRDGQDVVLSPKPPASGEALLEALDAFDPGAPIQREQPQPQKRAAIKPRK